MTDLAPRETINFIAFLRGPAALLVVFNHLVHEWVVSQMANGWVPFTIARRILCFLGLPSVGLLGVCIFFLVSGFIITHVAQNEGRATFAVKRLFRIYPAFIVSTLLIFLLTLSSSFRAVLPPENFEAKKMVLSLLFLSNNILLVNPVVWSIFLEVSFYVMTFLFLPFSKKSPSKCVLYNMAVAGTLAACSFYAAPDAGITRRLPLLMFLLLGQILYYYLWAKRISFVKFALLSAIAFAFSLAGLSMIGKDPATNLIYSYIIFTLALLCNKSIKMGKVNTFLSEISYSLFLNHWRFGWFLLVCLTPVFAYEVALLITSVLVLVLSYLSWEYIEKPCMKLGRAVALRISVEHAAVHVKSEDGN